MISMKQSDKKYLRPDEVKEYYGMKSIKTVYAWIDLGKLKAVRVAGRTLRIPAESLNEIESTSLD
jgi:excisionase family DNA binding protein